MLCVKIRNDAQLVLMKTERRRLVYISELLHKEHKNTHQSAYIFKQMNERETKENSKSDHYVREQDDHGIQ